MVNFGEALHIFLNCPIRKPVVYLRKQMLFFFFFFFFFSKAAHRSLRGTVVMSLAL